MFKRSSLFVGIITFFLVVGLSAPGADAKKKKKKNFFEVSKYKVDGASVSLGKPNKSKVSKAGNISESVSDTRPVLKLIFKTLRNKQRSSTVTMNLAFTPDDENDLRRITMTGKVIVKVKSNGKKITKSSIKGGKFSYTGIDSTGAEVAGGTIDVANSALSAKKKTCTLKSELLLDALTAVDKIGAIGNQAGDFNYTLTLSGANFKLQKKTLKKIKGLLTVTE